MVEIIEAQSWHKYLGRYLPGECAFREVTEINHRIQCAWYKFGLHRRTLCNQKISVRLRLKLFDAIVTPTILFGLATLPLSSLSLQKIEMVQRKMQRKIVGWVRIDNETWEETMHRMKYRVNRALQQYGVMPWKERIGKYLWKMILRIKSASNEAWIRQSSMWAPNETEDALSDFLPHRCRGQPSLKWDSAVRRFCTMYLNGSWQNLSIDTLRRSADRFQHYFCNTCDHDVA